MYEEGSHHSAADAECDDRDRHELCPKGLTSACRARG